MVITNDPELAAKARKLRDQAYESERRYLHKELGFSYRLTNIQAAIGLAQLERIEDFIRIRRRNAELYSRLLRNLPLRLPIEAEWAKNIYWMYTVLVEDNFGISRDTLSSILRQLNIDSRPFFYPIHLQPLYQHHFTGQIYPVAEDLSQRGLSLPSGNELNESQVSHIANAISSIYKQRVSTFHRI